MVMSNKHHGIEMTLDQVDIARRAIAHLATRPKSLPTTDRELMVELAPEIMRALSSRYTLDDIVDELAKVGVNVSTDSAKNGLSDWQKKHSKKDLAAAAGVPSWATTDVAPWPVGG